MARDVRQSAPVPPRKPDTPLADIRLGTDPTGPIVVCVHGGMDRLAAFAKFRRQLHDRCPELTTVAYDRRGYASSVALAIDPRFDRQIDDLESVWSAADPSRTRSCIFLGHSLGATIALAGAARLAATVRSASLIGVIAAEPPMSWMPWWPSGAGASTLAVHAEAGPEAAAEAFMRRIVGDRVWERLPAATQAARRAEGAALVNDLQSLRTGGVPIALSAVAAPVTLVRGTATTAHAKRGTEYAASLLADARIVVIEGAPHGLHTSHPEVLVGAVEEMLTRTRHIDGADRR
jgi:non-heme chloroperoxidase